MQGYRMGHVAAAFMPSPVQAPSEARAGAGRGERMVSLDVPTVLALNSGSSSLKFGLYRVGRSPPEVLFSGEADLAGGSAGRFRVDDPRGAALVRETASFTDQHRA